MFQLLTKMPKYILDRNISNEERRNFYKERRRQKEKVKRIEHEELKEKYNELHKKMLILYDQNCFLKNEYEYYVKQNNDIYDKYKKLLENEKKLTLEIEKNKINSVFTQMERIDYEEKNKLLEENFLMKNILKKFKFSIENKKDLEDIDLQTVYLETNF